VTNKQDQRDLGRMRLIEPAAPGRRARAWDAASGVGAQRVGGAGRGFQAPWRHHRGRAPRAAESNDTASDRQVWAAPRAASASGSRKRHDTDPRLDRTRRQPPRSEFLHPTPRSAAQHSCVAPYSSHAASCPRPWAPSPWRTLYSRSIWLPPLHSLRSQKGLAHHHLASEQVDGRPRIQGASIFRRPATGCAQRACSGSSRVRSTLAGLATANSGLGGDLVGFDPRSRCASPGVSKRECEPPCSAWSRPRAAVPAAQRL
jgi:hypothetical protein